MSVRRASGNIQCKYGVICDRCNLCKRGCQANPDCNMVHEETPIERPSLRRRFQVDYKEKDESMIKLVQRVDEIVSHRNLSLKSVTVTDLAHVYR